MSGSGVTVKDIARMLNISPSTVSRVLNGKGYYSDEMKEKIMKAVEETGFVYNMSAKGLRNSKSYTIGLMVPDVSNLYFSTMALLVEQFFRERGYSTFICNTGSNPNTEHNLLNNLASNRVDGIICISQLTKIPTLYEAHKIPIVTVDRYPVCDFPVTKIINDEFSISYQLGELFIKRGCRNILILAETNGYLVSNERTFARYYGFYQALKDNGIAHNSKKNVLAVPMSDNVLIEAEAAVRAAIYARREFDGIYAISDRLAIGAVFALTTSGVKVPEQVKVAGFDNSIFTSIMKPSITTIERNIPLMARTACEKLLDLIESGAVSDDEEIIIPARIIEQESTR